jgi:hypothetical protein
MAPPWGLPRALTDESIQCIAAEDGDSSLAGDVGSALRGLASLPVASLPARGAAVRELGMALPPARMPLLHRGRPLKSWHWVGVFGPELMLCVGAARVAGIPQRWWAVAEPDGTLHEGRGRRMPIELELGGDTGEAVEVASPHGGSYIWTRKQATVPVRASVRIAGHEQEVEGVAFIDDSAGYHARRTDWRWSAGIGRGTGNERVAWNLVTGVHDAVEASERTVWVDGRAHEVGPVEFAADLSRVGGLSFEEWCAREDHTRRGPFRSDYRQPFGSFSGELPNGVRLAAGYGVMEWHRALW